MSNEYEQPVEPMSRTEDLLRTGTEEPVIAMSEIEKILRGEHIDRPHSRVADLLLQYNPSDILIEKRIEENGTYYATADAADGYYKVVVDTPVIPPTVLEHLVETVSTNGTHTFTPETGYDGFSDASITVNVPANVNEHGFPTNGVFNSSVYGLDGFNKAIVTMQTAAVRSATLNATQNGTYMPSVLAVETLPISTIPDETETGVIASESLSNYDILRVAFTNKTTGVAGSRDIYPGNITNRSSNISFYDRTIFVGDDADHYITLASSQATIYVLQKGYNITEMKLIKKAGYFSEVDVNVPTGPDIDYLYDWDFTESLTDKVEGQTAVLSGATRDSEGLHFVSKTDSCLLLSDINMVGKTIEVDISHMDSKETNTSVISQSRSASSSIYDNSPLKYIYGNTWSADGRSNQNHQSDTTVAYTPTLSGNAFNGKTAKIVYFPDCTILYIDDEFTALQDGCNPALFREDYLHYLYLGNSGYSYGMGFYNMTITGCRIYNNILTEKTITQNGTYYAPNDNVDGYLKVNANIPLGTKSITANDTYTASDDNYAGYSEVTVNVSPNVGTKSITSNGTYNASSDSLDGYSQVVVNTPSPKAPTGYNRIFKETSMDLWFDPSGKFKSIWYSNTAIGLTLQGYSDLNGTITSLHITGSITDSYEYNNKTGFERCQFIIGFTDHKWDNIILVGYNDNGSAYIKEEITLTNQQEVNDIDIEIDLTDPQYEQYASTPKYFFISLLGISGEFDVTLE